MEPTPDGSEVVIRFSPFSGARLVENAEDTFADDQERGRNPPRFGVSVLAGSCLDGETISDTVTRICNESPVGRKSRTIAVVTGTILRAAGFELVSDPTDQVRAHHLVGEDPFTAVPDGAALESIFDAGRMRNPSWTKGK